MACSKAPAQPAEAARELATSQSAPAMTATESTSAAAVPPPQGTAHPSSQTSRSVEIRSFDCYKSEDAPESGATPAEHALLSRWAAGGPAGASWNASDLTCIALVYADCAQGALEAWLTVGSHRVAASSAPITQHGLQAMEFAVRERLWRRGLDPARKPPLSYRTALFVLRVEVSCLAPSAFDPRDFPYREVSDVSAFVAGFATGE